MRHLITKVIVEKSSLNLSALGWVISFPGLESFLYKWGHFKFLWLKNNIFNAMSSHPIRIWGSLGHRFTPFATLFLYEHAVWFWDLLCYWIRTIHGSPLLRRTYCCSHPSFILISWKNCTFFLQPIVLASCSLTFKEDQVSSWSIIIVTQSIPNDGNHLDCVKHSPFKFLSLAQVEKKT